MSNKKYYFASEHDERSYLLDYHIDDAKDEGLTEVELIEAIPITAFGTGFFWCRAEDEVCEDGCCGKDCPYYSPKNGKSGMCRHKSNTFYEHGEKIIFEVNS